MRKEDTDKLMEEMGFEQHLRKECHFSRQGSKRKAFLIRVETCRGTEARPRYAHRIGGVPARASATCWTLVGWQGAWGHSHRAPWHCLAHVPATELTSSTGHIKLEHTRAGLAG